MSKGCPNRLSLVWLVGVIFLGCMGIPFPNARSEQPPNSGPVVVIVLDGTVGPVMETFVRRALAKARRMGAALVVFEIDSPGGLASSSFELAELFQQINWTRTVVYVPREALSGAAIAALGCGEIYLAENARFGNAGPIYLAEGGLFRHVPEKLRSDLALRMRQLAEYHDRPPTLAEAFVDSNLKVFQFRHKETQETRYYSDQEWTALSDRDQWEKVAPVVESGDGRFLEVTGKRAVELKLANGTAATRDDLLKQLQITGVPIEMRKGTIDYLVVILNHPLVTGLLFVAGLVALYIEVSAPGLGLGGLISALCFALFFWSRFLGGTAGLLEVVLFLLGIGLLLIELFLLPGFGVFGITGLLLIVASLVLAGQEFVIPQTAAQRQQLAASVTVIVGSGVVFLICAFYLARYFGSLPILSKLMLAPPGDATQQAESSSPAEVGPIRVGMVGVTETPLRPGGKATFGTFFVDVVTEGEFLDRGCKVEVLEVAGNRIVVRSVQDNGKNPSSPC